MESSIRGLPDSPEAREVWRWFGRVEGYFRDSGCPLCHLEAVNFLDEGGDGGFELRHADGCEWGALHAAIYGDGDE
jgi:hypothetical protein